MGREVVDVCMNWNVDVLSGRVYVVFKIVVVVVGFEIEEEFEVKECIEDDFYFENVFKIFKVFKVKLIF